MSKSRASLTVGSLIGVPVFTPLAGGASAGLGVDFGERARNEKRKKRGLDLTASSDEPSALATARQSAPMSPGGVSAGQPRTLTRAPSRSCCRMGCAGCPWADAQRRAGGLLPILGR